MPQAAIADYSNISELEADPLIGVGYRFMGPFAVELDYLTGDSNRETADVGSADVEIWNILDNLDARASFNFYDGQKFGDLKRSLSLGLHYQFGRTAVQQVVRTESVDSDNDGVIDSQDVCLGTRVGVEVDIRGCARPADTTGHFR